MEDSAVISIYVTVESSWVIHGLRNSIKINIRCMPKDLTDESHSHYLILSWPNSVTSNDVTNLVQQILAISLDILNDVDQSVAFYSKSKQVL